MHTVLSRDGTDPLEFRSIATCQLKKYPSIQTKQANIVSVAQAEVAPGYMGFKAIDSENNSYTGRKLVLATGTADILPKDIPGYAENWPGHM